jgi:hypothetical protein
MGNLSRLKPDSSLEGSSGYKVDIKGGEAFFFSLKISVEKFRFFIEFFLIELKANAFSVEKIMNLPQLSFALDEGGEAQPLMTLGKEDPAQWKLEERIDHEIF